MERFWRTLREGCLDFIGSAASLHDINVRLYAWLDEHYHKVAHGSLMGKTPEAVYLQAKRKPDDFDEARLRAALTVTMRRRVRRDCTLSVDGHDWETDLGFLAGTMVTLSQCLVDPNDPPWIEHDGKKVVLSLVDPTANSRRSRKSAHVDHPVKPTGFDPNRHLLDRALGRKSHKAVKP